METKELIKKLRKQDQALFASLIDAYSRLLWVVAARYLTKSAGFSAEDIEECVSDVFLQLWEHPERYEPEKGALKSYLCTLAKNMAVSRFRKSGTHSLVYFEDIPEQGEPLAREPEEVDDYQALYTAISRLPEPTREILIRRYFYDEKPAGIAQRLVLPKKEVENRLYRGKQSLLQTLSKLREVQ